jgi:hypothetical protein
VAASAAAALAAGKVTAKGRISGAAMVHAAGTDSRPIAFACPTPAATGQPGFVITGNGVGGRGLSDTLYPLWMPAPKRTRLCN